MFVNQWEILLVDDEPDVLNLSNLVMRMGQLNQLEDTPLSVEGDKYALDDGHILISVTPQPDREEVKALISTELVPPADIVRVVHSIFVGQGYSLAASTVAELSIP